MAPQRPSGARPQAEDDALFAWSSAINIELDLDEDDATNEQSIQRALDNHPLVGGHVWLLLSHVQANPDRLIAAADLSRRQHADRQGDLSTGGTDLDPEAEYASQV
ncbi:hypothetical protein ACFQ07_05815, partial [Actinomadura adrarensis]